ncbi:MFS transporter [Sphingopyxis sp. H038]|nr:MFS transporter [Sphingopyxis sp. H012]KTE08682.1 MFS transporter [Sphingopyxis sp. H053]KTE10206.1 MFS transporter [Sphingopyxis sp. H093]KTE28348.1 MFS transporter [Sphingopyxis sp. H080]KTE32281.1 MFS transporter [Sphingopyxis sp. H038]KTE40908.1 MFS transporter [Sphingopyxis sp. H005]KTE41135.1 MFS transporter [Sphingopyxis sp. H077]KTE66681.1 MFS transporter [Sphingopyxis sp. H085]
MQMNVVQKGVTDLRNLTDSSILFRKAQHRMLFAAMFCYLFFYTGRQTFGFAIPGIQAEFGVSKETLGWVSAALLWCYAIGQAINGNLGDKYGGRRVMSAGAILSCIANWAASFATGVLSLGALWGLNGYFQAMGWAPGSRLLSNWFGKHERGKVFGFYVFAAGMASVLSFVTSIIVVHVLQLDWRWIFRLPVLLMLVGGIAFYLIARERPEDLGFQSPHDDVADEDTAPDVADDESSWARYKAVLSNWRLLLGGLAIGFQNSARYGLLVWVPVHFLGGAGEAAPSNSFIDPQWISVALPVGMAIGAATNGWVSDNVFGSKRYLAIVLYMVLATVTSLFMYTIPASDVYLGLATLFLCGFFVYGPQSSFWALCPDLVGHKRAGTAIGIMNFFAYLFAGLGEPLIGGFMDTHHDTSLVFLIVAGASAASATVALFIRR